MKTNRLAILVLILFTISGCSTIKSDRPLCIATGAVLGGGGTAIGDDDAEYVLVGAAAGALLAYFVCDPDEDGDGVNDDADRCPGTTRGVAVDSEGCPLDRDGDGVPDHRDTCPNTPAGAKVDSRGCAPDADMDGVADSVDQCPGTERGKSVDSKGCHITLSLTGLNFATDSSDLSAAAKGRLAEAVRTLNQNPRMRVRVEGHTDSTGSEAYNQALSERRAKAVVQYLIGQGISANRLESRGYGEARPVAPNNTMQGRASNRRVDFAVIAN